MPMYNLIECSDNYSNPNGILWYYCTEEPVLAGNGDITNLNPIMPLVCLIL